MASIWMIFFGFESHRRGDKGERHFASPSRRLVELRDAVVAYYRAAGKEG